MVFMKNITKTDNHPKELFIKKALKTVFTGGNLETGQLRIETTFNEGKEAVSIYFTYHENGQLSFKRNYKDGRLDGPF